MTPTLKKKIFWTAIGTCLFWLFCSFVIIPTGLDTIYVYLQYPILCQFSVWLGPVCGMVMGMLGHLLGDITRGDGNIYFSWMVGSGLLGLGLGLFGKRREVVQQPDRRGNALRYSVSCAIGCLIAFGLVTPLLNILFYHEAPSEAFRNGLFAALSDGLTSIVVGQVVIGSAKSGNFRRIAAVIVLIDAMLLLSYGRRGIGNVAVYLLTVILSLYALFGDLIRRHSKKGIGRAIRWAVCIVGALWVLFMGFLMVEGYTNGVQGNEKAIIVLGAGLDGTEPNTILKSRLDKAAGFAKEHPDTVIVVSGGQGEDEVIPEALAMKNYLTAQGIREERILQEDRSTTTIENFGYSAALLQEYGISADDPVGYVTSEYHCARAGVIAADAGLTNARALPAATSIGSLLPSLMRECLSVLRLAFTR